ncbi:MAG: hypothetical protein AAB824_02125 [Patescibacteria group bacterium]
MREKTDGDNSRPESEEQKRLNQIRQHDIDREERRRAVKQVPGLSETLKTLVDHGYETNTEFNGAPLSAEKIVGNKPTPLSVAEVIKLMADDKNIKRGIIGFLYQESSDDDHEQVGWLEADLQELLEDELYKRIDELEKRLDEKNK